MRKLTAFTNVTANGYFTDAQSKMEWAHLRPSAPDWDKYVAGNAQGESALVLGRKTYDMMASFWPTPAAKAQMPKVAEGMNRSQKIVFSRTLDSSPWENTTIIRDDMAGAIRRLKSENGPGMTILGSGSIVAQLAEQRLIDEFTLVVNTVALGDGKTLFGGVKEKLTFKLTRTQSFSNGNVVLTYEPE